MDCKPPVLRAAGRARGADGFVLIAVLWILGALATLAVIYAVYVVNAAASVSVDNDRLQVESSLSGALELTAYYLETTEQAARPSSGTFTFPLGANRVTVRFVSEAARIDLNKAEKPLLTGLFGVLGASSDAAAEYADRVIGWRSPSSEELASRDKEIAAYRAAGLRYDPREGPFNNVQELWLVLGLPPAMVERMMPYVTVFSGMAAINVMDAAPAVLAALPGMTPERLDDLLNSRNRPAADRNAILASLGTSGSVATTDASKAYRVSVEVGLPQGRRFAAEAVILLLQDAPDPYRVLSWTDGFDG